MIRLSLYARLFLLLASLVCGATVVAPEARAQAMASLIPRKGEIRLSGTLTEVDWVKGRCVLFTAHVALEDGMDKPLPQPKSKTITIGAGTTYATLASTENPFPVLLNDPQELRRGMPVFVVGKNGTNGVFVSRLICLMTPAGQAPVIEEVREPSEPPGKNLLLPTDRVENWGWTLIEPAKATLEREEGAVKVTVAEAGKEDWRVQLSQSAAFPEPGVSYTLSFRARAEPARRMRISAQVLGSDFHDIGINRVAALDGEWKQYEYTFVARNLGAKGHILPVFFFGTEKGATWLSDVTVSVSSPEQRGNLLESVSNPLAWKLTPLLKDGTASLRITADGLEVGTSAVSKEKRETAYHLLPSSAAPLIPGRTYVLSFRGRSGAERTLRIRGIAELVTLGPEEKSFEVRFRVNRLTDFGVSPTFLIAEQLGTFTLRNMVLREERNSAPGKPK
jgi:hypothetical protein